MLLYPIKYFWDRKIVPGFKIKKNDLVLDIGSGDKPFWRGNVFLDNLELKNLHRHTDTQTIKDLGLFVNGDITKTKFKNKAFDFSFCTHLLEHVDRPDLGRVKVRKRKLVEGVVV
jgi:ubiquinone/menaquinone biosynthesis C-methylase UbiE